MDLTGLPLFSGVLIGEPARPKQRRRPRRSLVSEGIAAHVDLPGASAADAEILPFPASRDTRLVADLAQAFIGLRERYGRRCRAMLLDRRFRPIAARLRRLGVPPAAVEQELARLEAAVARLVWRHDGCPVISAGGGSAA